MTSLRAQILRCAMITSILPFFIHSATAQSDNPAWVDDLTLQLLVDYECNVVEYEVLHEGKLGGRNTFTAKAVCEDGRKYDANRVGENKDFAIRICEVVKC